MSDGYLKRNYVSNAAEFNTVISSLTSTKIFSLERYSFLDLERSCVCLSVSQNGEETKSSILCRNLSQKLHYLLRDVYEDMLLDRVQPKRDTFHSLIVGTMKGSQLQDAFFFREEMKAMGLVPDVNLYNFLISLSGKCKNSQLAIRVFEEMKRYEVKPTGQTFVCLLNACAADGRLDVVNTIVRDMTTAGLGLNKFCYAGLIAAHKNNTSTTEDTGAKIIEFVEKSKSWSSVEAAASNAENFMMDIFEEELYTLPTIDLAHRRGAVNRQLTVYHSAFHACADLKNVEAMETLLDMLKKENCGPDMFIQLQVMRCYLQSGDIDAGQRVYDEFLNSKNPPPTELFTIFAEGAMVGYTPKGMELALSALENTMSRNFFLFPRLANDLLLIAAGEKTGGYTVANYIWDLMQSRKVPPTFAAVEAYYQGLKDRDIPENDQRLMLVARTYDDLKPRLGPGFAPPRGSRPAQFRDSRPAAPPPYSN